MNEKAMGTLLYLFSHPISTEWERVVRGDTPSERLYGAYELKNKGWIVRTSDARFQGPMAPLIRLLRSYGINLLNWRTIKEIRSVDLVVVKDDFSLMTTIVCKIFQKKLIYLDSMFMVPHRWWRRFAVKMSIKLSDRVVGYSESQVRRWSSELGVAAGKFIVLPYTLDMEFYTHTRADRGPNTAAFVLAVGRDMGRDFPTLVKAARLARQKLTLVTLPYLLRGIELTGSEVDVRQNLAYSELFSLYAEAMCVVIPLHSGVDYPSGIRAMLEALVLGCPVVATGTPALKEYVEGDDVTFVKPCDARGLADAIEKYANLDATQIQSLSASAQKYKNLYKMEKFVAGFESIVSEVVGRKG